MDGFVASVDLLKQIIEHLHEPWLLDSHPWAKSRFAQNADGVKPGEKLARAVRQIFRETMPSIPPRRGKRLDTRWGEFGLLAAQYFAPLEFGLPAPRTQRDAWQDIDQAILLFVFGPDAQPTDEQRAAYRIVGDEPQIAPNSTISGWNHKALQGLLTAITQREHHFVAQSEYKTKPRLKNKKYLALGILLCLAVLLLAGWKAYTLAQRAQAVKEDLNALELSLANRPGIEQFGKIGSQVSTLRTDLDALQAEALPFLWLTPALGWVPTYGGDLAQASDLLQLAGGLTAAADEGIRAVTPAVESAVQTNDNLDVPLILEKLQAGEARLLTAQVALAQALDARRRIDDGRLSETVRGLLQKRVDPLLSTIAGNFPIEDALTLLQVAPTLLGVGQSGPQTYLLLMQNEDELRPTGGFITAVGSVVIHNGELLNIQIEAVELIDDRSKPYPKPPWQLEEYMLSGVLVLRDSNWFTNFPTTARMAEYLYSYSRAHSVDGVIAIDQHVVVELLDALGPVRVEGVVSEINAANVLEYMRSAKEPRTPIGVIGGTWDRKQFIGRLAQPIVEKILAARGATWSSLAESLIRLLDERHILLQFDDPDLDTFLARHRWDGGLRPPDNSDFLMTVDSNIGFNKSNAVMQTSLSYDVDLSHPTEPRAHLDVTHTNQASGDVPCEPRPPRKDAAADYPINECHWTYLRVYTPAGTSLLASTPHAISAQSTMAGVDIAARTDDLGSEDIAVVQVFGTFMVIHQGESLQTGFDFGLPASVLRRDTQSGAWTYTLTVQKQPGTLAVPLHLRIRLPDGARLVSSSPTPENSQETLEYQLKLLQDISLRVEFQMP